MVLTFQWGDMGNKNKHKLITSSLEDKCYGRKEQGKGDCKWTQGGQISILNKMVRVGLSEKVAFDQRHKRWWGRETCWYLDEEYSKQKGQPGPETRVLEEQPMLLEPSDPMKEYLAQESAIFFRKGADSKYFRLMTTQSVSLLNSAYKRKAAIGNMKMNSSNKTIYRHWNFNFI